MKSKITFEESIASMKGSFTIYRKNGESCRNVKSISEFRGQLRYTTFDAIGEFRLPLEEIEEIIIAKWKDIEIVR